MKLHSEQMISFHRCGKLPAVLATRHRCVDVTGARNECVKYTNEPEGTPRNSREDEPTSS